MKSGNITMVGAMLEINDDVKLKYLRLFIDWGLGNYVVMKIHWNKASVSSKIIQAAMKLCVENNIYFSISEYLDRYTAMPHKNLESLNAGNWKQFKELAGKYYISNLTVCERGGAVYWPLKYKKGTVLMPNAENMEDAHDCYVQSLKDIVKKENGYGRYNLESIDSSLLQKYHLEAGVEMAGLEVFPGNLDLMFPAVRGAMRAKGKNYFFTDIAMFWYGGVIMDELRFKRWKLSLYYSYIAGADKIYSETGEFGVSKVLGNSFDIDSPVCTRQREVLKEFYEYTKNDVRPCNGPIAQIAVVHGRHDGAAGLWNKEVWGQYRNEKWLEGDAENSWSLISQLLKKYEWFTSERYGEFDFSGNPPLGQFDIIPIEAPVEILRKYSCLVFLGWNSMDEETYLKLIEYVEGGGHLLMSLGHLNTELDRVAEMKLFRNGNIEDLFGVNIKEKSGEIRHSGIKIIGDSIIETYKFANITEWTDPKWMDTVIPAADVEIKDAGIIAKVTGVVSEYQLKYWNETEKMMPALIEHKLGKGVAYLVTLWGYPAGKGIKAFYEELLKVVNIGEMGADLKVCASDKVRYSVFEEEDKYILYFLNTDFDLPQAVKLFTKHEVKTFSLEPVSIKKIETLK